MVKIFIAMTNITQVAFVQRSAHLVVQYGEARPTVLCRKRSNIYFVQNMFLSTRERRMCTVVINLKKKKRKIKQNVKYAATYFFSIFLYIKNDTTGNTFL